MSLSFFYGQISLYTHSRLSQPTNERILMS